MADLQTTAGCLGKDAAQLLWDKAKSQIWGKWMKSAINLTGL